VAEIQTMSHIVDLCPFDEAGWCFVQTSLARRWCGPVAGKPWTVSPHMKEEKMIIIIPR